MVRWPLSPTRFIVIYSATSDLPGAALTEITRVPVPIVDEDAGTIKTVGIEATVDAQYLVCTIEIPDSDTAQFSVGSNNLGETAPTYISSAACGIATPVTMAGIGFPDVHLIMSVRDFVTLSVDDYNLDAISVYPNPTKDFGAIYPDSVGSIPLAPQNRVPNYQRLCHRPFLRDKIF